MKRTTLSLCLVTGAAAVVAASTATSAGADPGRHDRSASNDVVAEIRRAVAPYQDVTAALADGYEAPPAGEHQCVPGMGHHYVNLELMGSNDPAAPPILLYGSDGEGGLELLGVEFFLPEAAAGGTRPSLRDEPYDGPMDGHGGAMPRHYDLHVWTHLANPDGVFATTNRRVSCG